MSTTHTASISTVRNGDDLVDVKVNADLDTVTITIVTSAVTSVTTTVHLSDLAAVLNGGQPEQRPAPFGARGHVLADAYADAIEAGVAEPGDRERLGLETNRSTNMVPGGRPSDHARNVARSYLRDPARFRSEFEESRAAAHR